MSTWIPAFHAGMTQLKGFCLKSVVKPIAGHVALVVRGHVQARFGFKMKTEVLNRLIIRLPTFWGLGTLSFQRRKNLCR